MTQKSLLRLLVIVMLACQVGVAQELAGSFLRDLTSRALDTVNNVIDDTVGFLRDEAAPCLSCSPPDPDRDRNVSQIIESRGFIAEEHEVVTRDGYILIVQRIINPLLNRQLVPKPKPVILQHGLMSSSVDWVVNSLHVRPAVYPRAKPARAARDPPPMDSQEEPNALGFYLANEGYDVWLANSRGNIYGQRHKRLSAWEPKFWDFTFDEQIKFDLPDTIKYVQTVTNQTKLSYVGHSQGTVMMFGLMSEQPEYADQVEPFVALAPVAFCDNTISPVRYFAPYTPIFQHVNMWFATSNMAVRYLAPIVCGPKVIRRELCANIFFLSIGFDEDEIDMDRYQAYLSHMPSGTSVKNVAHYGQEVLSGRFAHFDHGILGNQIRYKQIHPPDYPLERIRSKSIVLFMAENDWLASPKDVAKLRAKLTVEPYAVFNLSQHIPKWNHVDFVYGKHAGHLVNTPIVKIMDHFRQS